MGEDRACHHQPVFGGYQPGGKLHRYPCGGQGMHGPCLGMVAEADRRVTCSAYQTPDLPYRRNHTVAQQID